MAVITSLLFFRVAGKLADKYNPAATISIAYLIRGGALFYIKYLEVPNSYVAYLVFLVL